MVTPNINTPVWKTSAAEKIKTYTRRVFLYVKVIGTTSVNDDESIKNIKCMFGQEEIVHVVTYCKDEFKLQKDVFYSNMTTKELDEITTATFSNIRKKLGLNPVNPAPRYEEQKRDKNAAKPTFKGVKNTGDTGQTSKEGTTHESKLKSRDDINNQDIELFHKTLEIGRAKSNHVRVNVIGNQSAGKTTLIKRLQGMDIKCPDKNLKPTEALEINRIVSSCIEIDGQKQWDTNADGYVIDYNEQRMAQAMKSVSSGNTTQSIGTRSNTTVENLDNPDFINGSDSVEEIESENIPKSNEVFARNTLTTDKAEYIKRILQRKNESTGERMYLSYWDFAGQSTYYSTHQMFMSASAVYVLVVDLSLDLNSKLQDNLMFRSGMTRKCTAGESLIFWLSSIKAFASDSKGGHAPVIIVGTHVDMVKKQASERNMHERVLIDMKCKEIREVLKVSEVQLIAIDNVNPNNEQLDELRNSILELGLGVMDEEIPARWIDLERRLIGVKTERRNVFMKFSELQEIDAKMDFPMKDEIRLQAFLGYMHQRGNLIHFMEENLKNLIILEPDVLAKFLNSLMRSGSDTERQQVGGMPGAYNNNGLINRIYMVNVVTMIPEIALEGENLNVVQTDLNIKLKDQTVDTLLNLLKHLSIIRPYRYEGDGMRYILPCLLPPKPNLEERIGKVFKVVFTDNHFPPSFYHILLAELMNEWKPIENDKNNEGKPAIYNLHALFCLKSEAQIVEIFWEQSCVYIKIIDFLNTLTGEDVLEILQTVTKRIKTLFTIYRHNIKNYNVICPCPVHADEYLSLKELNDRGVALCYKSGGNHPVTYKDIFNTDHPRKETLEQLNQSPTYIQLGILARHLDRGDIGSLASQLNVHFGVVEVDSVAEKIKDNRVRRLKIFDLWKRENGSCTLRDLIEMLNGWQDYTEEDLLQIMTTSGQTVYDRIEKTKLDAFPRDIDIEIVYSNAGVLFPFLAIELGLQAADIRRIIEDGHEERRKRMIKDWASRYRNTATTKQLLDAASAVGLDLLKIQTQINNAC